MTTAGPRLSILMPAYNAAAFLPATLQTVLAQTFTDWEVLIVDDASTDDTERVARRFASDRVRYFRDPKNSGGPSRPRNVGLGHARGSVIALCDADDLLMPTKYERAIDVLDALPEVDFVFTDCSVVDGEGRVTRERFLADYRLFRRFLQPTRLPGVALLKGQDAYPELIRADFIAVSGAVFRRSVLDEVGTFDEGLTFSEAIDFWMRVARHGKTFAFVDEVGHHYRQWPGNMTNRGLRNYPIVVDVLERQWDHVGHDTPAGAVLREKLQEVLGEYGWALRKLGHPRRAVRVYRQALGYGLNGRAIKGMCLSLAASLAQPRERDQPSAG